MKRVIIVNVLLFLIFISCNRVRNTDPLQGNTESAPVNIVVDETFNPVIDEQLYVFKNDYPKENINVVYQPEVQALNTFFSGGAAIAILSDTLSSEQKKIFENKKIVIRVNRIAVDGVALIANASSKDSIITVGEIMDVMRGKANRTKDFVFDNANSSTVRYLKNLSGIKDLPKAGVYALKSNLEVIKYVHDNPGVIGVVGINWIEQPDKENAKYVEKIRIMGVKNVAGKPGSDKFYTPDQSTLALGLYPLTRNLYIINCQGGLSNFAAYVAGENGQRLILKSGLLPDKIPPREINVKN